MDSLTSHLGMSFSAFSAERWNILKLNLENDTILLTAIMIHLFIYLFAVTTVMAMYMSTFKKINVIVIIISIITGILDLLSELNDLFCEAL